MLGVIGVLIFIFGLLGSIALHEIGHMVPAKKFGVRVTQYMVGFGPTVWSRKRGETEYGLKAIPMGGYIRMIGMYPPRSSSVAASGRFADMIEQSREESLQEVAAGEDHRTFYNLSVPKKLTVMFCGPFMNLVLAFVFFALSMSAIGSPQATTQIRDVVACIPTSANPNGLVSTDGTCGSGSKTAASVLGLQRLDTIKSVNRSDIRTWDDLGNALANTAGKKVDVSFERNGKLVNSSVVMTSLTDPTFERNPNQGFLGVSPAMDLVREPVTAVPIVVWQQTKSAISGLSGFPNDIVGLGKNLVSDDPRDPNGPVGVIGVGRISGEISNASEFSISAKIGALLSLLASLNLVLFIFNLIPILPLDGGHMASAAYEGVRRSIARMRGVRPLPGPSDTARMLPVTYIVGLILIAASLLVAFADIVKPITLG